MLEFVARGVIVMTAGLLFLLAMLIAVAIDVSSPRGARKRRAPTQPQRNRGDIAWS